MQAVSLAKRGVTAAAIAERLGFSSARSVSVLLAKLRRHGVDVPMLPYGGRYRRRVSRHALGPGIGTEREDRRTDATNREVSARLLARLLKYHGRNPPDAESQRAALHYARLCHYPRERRP